jgi:hypothetical protein
MSYVYRIIGVVSVYMQYMVYNCVYYCDTYVSATLRSMVDFARGGSSQL